MEEHPRTTPTQNQPYILEFSYSVQNQSSTQKSISQGERIGPTIRSENNKIIFNQTDYNGQVLIKDGNLENVTVTVSYTHLTLPTNREV